MKLLNQGPSDTDNYLSRVLLNLYRTEVLELKQYLNYGVSRVTCLLDLRLRPFDWYLAVWIEISQWRTIGHRQLSATSFVEPLPHWSAWTKAISELWSFKTYFLLFVWSDVKALWIHFSCVNWNSSGVKWNFSIKSHRTQTIICHEFCWTFAALKCLN